MPASVRFSALYDRLLFHHGLHTRLSPSHICLESQYVSQWSICKALDNPHPTAAELDSLTHALGSCNLELQSYYSMKGDIIVTIA